MKPEIALPTPTVIGVKRAPGGVQQRLGEVGVGDHVLRGVRGDARVFGRVELVERGLLVLLHGRAQRRRLRVCARGDLRPVDVVLVGEVRDIHAGDRRVELAGAGERVRQARPGGVVLLAFLREVVVEDRIRVLVVEVVAERRGRGPGRASRIDLRRGEVRGRARIDEIARRVIEPILRRAAAVVGQRAPRVAARRAMSCRPQPLGLATPAGWGSPPYTPVAAEVAPVAVGALACVIEEKSSGVEPVGVPSKMFLMFCVP